MNETSMPAMGPPPPKHRPDNIRAYKGVKGKELTAHIFFPKGFSKSERIPGYDDPADNINYSNEPQAVALHTAPLIPRKIIIVLNCCREGQNLKTCPIFIT